MQTELFEMSSSPVVPEEPVVSKSTFLEKTFITLRLDQTIGVALVLLVIYVLAFSWGVEKGKRAVRGSYGTGSSSAVPVATETVKVVAAPSVNKSPEVVVARVTSQEMPVAVTDLPKPVAKVVLPNGKFTIQHVTYLTQSAADHEVERLAKLGQSAFFVPTGKHFLVCISSFQTKQEASKLLRQLRTQHLVSWDAYVRPIPNAA